ncbi:MAG: hypothetical protein WCT77_12815 [Bacteroidota bacterium]
MIDSTTTQKELEKIIGSYGTNIDKAIIISSYDFFIENMREPFKHRPIVAVFTDKKIAYFFHPTLHDGPAIQELVKYFKKEKYETNLPLTMEDFVPVK